jgi:chromosome segregation ATPase
LSCTLRSRHPLAQARENAQQWEKRAQQLQQKYGKVDLAEHQRVQQSLAAAQAELGELRASTDARQAQLQSQLDKVRPLSPW